MPSVELRTGATIDYIDQGEGEPVLLIHGMLGTGDRHFSQLIVWLSDNYRVIAPTVRGYGQSFPKPRDFPLDFYHRDADDMLAFMDAIGLEKTHIMGFSDGGEITLIMAGKQPDRFYTATAWGAVGYYGPDMRAVVQRMYPATWLKEDEMAVHGLTDANAFALGWINAVKHMIDSGGDVSLSLAPQIACPVLLMLGRQDTLNPESYAQKIVDQTPQGKLMMFDCGHPVHDQQWDAFKAAVGPFLENKGFPSA